MTAGTVDVHAHILLPETMGACGAAGPEMGVRDGVPYFRSGDYVLTHVAFADSPFSDVPRRLALMDRMGIDHQLLSPNPLTYFYAQPAAACRAFCDAANEAVAAVVARHPARFSGLAQLPLQDPALAALVLEQAAGRLGLKGSYIGSRIGGRDLSDPALEPVWAAHEALDVPVVVHPAPPDVERAPGPAGTDARRWDLDIVLGFGHDESLAIAHLLFGGVLDRHPRLRVHIPHGGGTAPWMKGRIRLALERRPWAKGLLRRPFEELWRQLSFDCLLPEPAAMRHLVATEGADRVMLGTNFAGWDQADGVVRAVAELGLPEQDLSAVLAGTARRFFALAG
jgi:aminocarboxymuconate-semialdehyde decarboxylase